MPRCVGFKADGTHCERIVAAEHSYCSSHDPTRVEERKRIASLGGKARGSTEIAGLKDEVRVVLDDLRHERVEAKLAAVLLQGYRVLRELIEQDRKQRELAELADLAAEVEELKRAAP